MYSVDITYIHLILLTHTNYNPELSCCLHETLSGPWLGNDALLGKSIALQGSFYYF